MRLSCTSVMLPSWTLDETFDKLAAHGYQGVELRVRDNPDATSEPSFWGRHIADVSPTNISDKAAAIRAAAARCGLQVVAFAPRCLVHETDLARRLFEAAIAIDPERPPMVRIGAAKHDRTRPYMPQFDQARTSFETLVEIARHMGVKLLYEIHVGTVAVTASRTRELLADLNPEHIGAIYDVPNMVRVGLEDTRMGLELLGPYLAHCHIGNGILVIDGQDRTGDLEIGGVGGADRNAKAADQVIGGLTVVGHAEHQPRTTGVGDRFGREEDRLAIDVGRTGFGVDRPAGLGIAVDRVGDRIPLLRVVGDGRGDLDR